MDEQEIRSRVSAMMPEILADLERLVAIPSVAFPGFPPEPVHEMAAETLEMFKGVGFSEASLQEVPTGYPPVYGEIPGPDGSPVVMLYGHYDVQPAPPEQGWTTDPWAPTRKDGRIFGRGAADDKGGLAIHIGTLKVFDGKPPVHGEVDRRGHGGDEQQPGGFRRRSSRAVRGRRLHRLRHGQPPGRRADAHDDAPR